MDLPDCIMTRPRAFALRLRNELDFEMTWADLRQRVEEHGGCLLGDERGQWQMICYGFASTAAATAPGAARAWCKLVSIHAPMGNLMDNFLRAQEGKLMSEKVAGLRNLCRAGFGTWTEAPTDAHGQATGLHSLSLWEIEAEADDPAAVARMWLRDAKERQRAKAKAFFA